MVAYRYGGVVGFKVKGKMTQTGGSQSWDSDGIQLTKIGVAAEFKGVKIAGELELFEDHAEFGKGFRGIVDAQVTSLKMENSITALAHFGKVNGMKYFMVDFLATISPGVGMGGLNLNGIGGGVFYNMSRPDTASVVFSNPPGTLPPIGQSLSGVQYTPEDHYLGFKVAAVLATAKDDLFNCNVSLEMTFKTDKFSLQRIDIAGNGQLMEIIDWNLPTVPSEDSLSVPGSAQIKASVNIGMDFEDGIYTGDLKVFANAAGGALRGAGTNNLMGTAEIYFGEGEWYLWVGTPQQPFAVELGIPNIISIQASAYLDIGNKLPDLKPLDSKYASLTDGRDIHAVLNGTGAGGGGVMFGSSFGFDTGDRTFAFLYYSAAAELGFDLAVRQYAGVNCINTGSELGINGWYATGQLYAYLAAELGVKFRNKKFEAGSFEFAAMLQGGIAQPILRTGRRSVQIQSLGWADQRRGDGEVYCR